MDNQIFLQYLTINTPLPNFIYEGIKSYSAKANVYQTQPANLIARLANKYKVSQDSIFLTAGIDEAIQMYLLAYGSNTFVFTPSYIEYSRAEGLGGKLTEINSINEDCYKISSASIPNATLIFLANPNNPSGITSGEKILELVKNNPHAQVVIDEAYGEFADLSVINEVKNYQNLTVFRSFSKGYGMAGNRIGYIISHPETITEIATKTQWSNVSYLSVGAAMTALDHEDYFQSLREDINARRDSLIEFLRHKGFVVLPSAINAVLIKFANEVEGTKFYDYLSASQIIGSHGNGNSNIGLDKSFVRLAIGTLSQMQTVQKVISEFGLS